MKPLYKPPPEKITVIRSAPVRQAGWLSSAPGKNFIRSIPLDWAMAAARVPGKANIVGQAIWFMAGLQRREHDLSIPSRVVKDFGISRRAFYDGLKSLAKEHLISLVRRPGAKTRVTIAKNRS